MATDGLVIISSINSLLEFSTDGGATYKELPFAGDIEASRAAKRPRAKSRPSSELAPLLGMIAFRRSE